MATTFRVLSADDDNPPITGDPTRMSIWIQPQDSSLETWAPIYADVDVPNGSGSPQYLKWYVYQVPGSTCYFSNTADAPAIQFTGTNIPPNVTVNVSPATNPTAVSIAWSNDDTTTTVYTYVANLIINGEAVQTSDPAVTNEGSGGSYVERPEHQQQTA